MVRVGVEELVEVFREICGKGEWGRPVFFMAPTGYGKTSSTPLLHRASLETGGPPRTIHVLPLRAVVEQVYTRLSHEMEEFTIGYQAHGLGLSGKTPFMAPDLVVSTLDSFMINLFRGNVAEGGGGQGHYEVPRAFVLTSTIVFDEAHMPLQAHGGEAGALHTAVAVMGRALVEMKCPFIIESATLPPSVLRKYAELLNHPSPIIIEPVPPGCKPDHMIPGAERILVPDHDFYSKALMVKWSVKETGEPVEKAIELAGTGHSVFRAVNTVEEAIEEYLEIRERMGEENVALIHGRMTPADRRKQLEKLERIERNGILVGTQAVEAGVDADFAALITDPACPESLIQRIGRVNRRLEREEALILVSKREDSQSIIRALKNINPRIPYDYAGFKGYTCLFKEDWDPRVVIERYDMLVKLALTPILSPAEVRGIHAEFCDIVRGSLLVPVAPHPADLGVEENLQCNTRVSEETGKLLLDNAFPLDQRLLYRKALSGKWLEHSNGGVLALAAEWRGDRNHPDNLEYKVVSIRIEALSSCWRLRSVFSRKHVVLLVLRKGAYVPGMGLC